MAITDKNIIITPRVGVGSPLNADPRIRFSASDAGSPDPGALNITLFARPINSGTLSFEGTSGQLFSITNDLTGTIFSVNDISGVPSIEVNADGTIALAEFGGNVGIGTGSPVELLHIQAADIANANAGVRIQARGDAYLELIADTDSDAETNNPYVTFSQDGAAVRTIIGSVGGVDIDAEGNAFTGMTNNGFAIHHDFAGGTVELGVNGAVGLSVDDSNNVDVVGSITVGGTVDGIDIATDVAANTSKVTNATHTGQVTGATALILTVSAVTAQPASGAIIAADTIITNDGGVLSEATFTQMDTYFNSSLSFGSGDGTVTSVTFGAGTLIDITGTNPITTSGTAMITVDLSESTEAIYAPGTDYVLFLDGGVSGTAAKESGADFATALAGTGLTAASGVINRDTIAIITVADESVDNSCFPAFFTAATGNLGPKTGTNLTFDSATGDLSATLIAGIANANLVDKTAVETITSAWTFTGSPGAVTLLDNDAIQFGTTGLRGDAQLYSDGTDLILHLDGPNNVDFRIRGGSSGAETMITCFDDGPVWLAHAGTVTLVTQSPIAIGNTSGVAIQSHDLATLDVGFNVLPIQEDNPANFTLAAQHCGQVIFANDETIFTITTPIVSSLDFPVGGHTTIINANTTGDITVSDTASATCFYMDGSAPTDIVGSATVGPGGVASLYRVSAGSPVTEPGFLLWGTGITA